jgi:hypothetical protein
MRQFVFVVISILIGCLLALGCAEILFRILPTNEGLRAQPVNAANPVFRFQPNRTAMYSEGWDFEPRNSVHVNNAGFVNDQDYDPDASGPLFAVVGDSYIESGITPYPLSVHGRLAAMVRGKARVYSFAASGAGLPQYLIWAEHVAKTYRPAGMMVSIIGNDFAESWTHLELSPGFHRFEKLPDGGWQFHRTDYEPSPTRTLLRHSALAMYLITNLKLHVRLSFRGLLQSLGPQDYRWIGNISATSDEATLAEYRRAADIFLDELPRRANLPPERLVLTFDGFRPGMYDPAADRTALTNSTWGLMRTYMMAEAARRGIETIDLDAVFRERYARDGKRFEYPTDSHWNGEGHGAAAEAVAQSRAFLTAIK